MKQITGFVLINRTVFKRKKSNAFKSLQIIPYLSVNSEASGLDEAHCYCGRNPTLSIADT